MRERGILSRNRSRRHLGGNRTRATNAKRPVSGVLPVPVSEQTDLWRSQSTNPYLKNAGPKALRQGGVFPRSAWVSKGPLSPAVILLPEHKSILWQGLLSSPTSASTHSFLSCVDTAPLRLAATKSPKRWGVNFFLKQINFLQRMSKLTGRILSIFSREYRSSYKVSWGDEKWLIPFLFLGKRGEKNPNNFGDAWWYSSLISHLLTTILSSGPGNSWGSCYVIFIFMIKVLHFIEFFTSAAESAMQDFT